MKNILQSTLLASALALTSSAAFGMMPCLQGTQLNPVMKNALQRHGAIISIYQHTYVVAQPGDCYQYSADPTQEVCHVGLLKPELHKAFNVVGPKGQAATIIPLTDLVMEYTQTTRPGYL